MKPLQTEFGTFNFAHEIGRGSNAVVYLGIEEETNMQVSLKILNGVAETYREFASIEREIKLMNTISHPFIADVYACVEYEGNVCLVCEYVNGITLLEYANANGPLDEMESQKIFHQLILTLEYLHSEKKIVHRDLKCENVLLDQNKNIRLVDFEFARELLQDGENNLCRTTCGSPAYIAPEIIQNNKYDYQVDIWSLGVLLYAITAGKLPFDDDNVIKMIGLVLNEEPDFPIMLSDNLVDLLKRMLTKDPHERITLREIRSHPWFNTDFFGRRLIIKSQVLNIYSVVPLPGQSLDKYVMKILDIPDSEEEKIISELLSKNPSVNTIKYKMLKKIRSIGEMATMNLVQSRSGHRFIKERRRSYDYQELPLMAVASEPELQPNRRESEPSANYSSPLLNEIKRPQSRIFRPNVITSSIVGPPIFSQSKLQRRFSCQKRSLDLFGKK